MPSIPNAARQQLQLFSARLGQLAAGLPRTPTQPSGPAPSPLAAILGHLGRRRTAQDATDKLKANEFMVGE